MSNYIKSNYVREEKIKVQGIPAILLRPVDAEKEIPSIIFYHGLGSSKENQRLRGLILACIGYQVLIPDAIYHGERSPLSDYGLETARMHFWDIIFNNIDESDSLLEELVLKYGADPDRIAVMGSSMGGFTAAGIFTHNKAISNLVVFNGSCGWENFNKNFEVPNSEKFKSLTKKVKERDPMNNLPLLKDRRILLLHGDSDTSVPIDSQRIFYNKLKAMNSDGEKLRLIEYPGLNHFIPTNMMGECIDWLGKNL